MPIENERKYIISLDSDKIEWLCEKYNGVLYNIKQAYINGGRIRLIEQQNFLLDYPRFIFTWKVRRPVGDMIEIETDISEPEFDDLWDMADTIITKQRVKILDHTVTWDIDFLADGGDHYLTIAEVEMPVGLNEPLELPDFVKDNLLFLVPRNQDYIWTNKKLSDSIKVRRMIKEVLEHGVSYYD